MGQDYSFYHKMKCKAVDNTLEQCFLKEFKATYKPSSKKKKQSEMHHRSINVPSHSFIHQTSNISTLDFFPIYQTSTFKS